MSNPSSKIDSRVNEPLGVGLTPDCFKILEELKALTFLFSFYLTQY